MGKCVSKAESQIQRKNGLIYKLNSNTLNQKQQYLLKLIYNDLKQRIPQKALNLQNFLLFFHKNGFWGVRLFQQFSLDQSNLITEQEFLNGIAKLTKTNQDKKIQLLFKFFASSTQSSQLDNKASPRRSNSYNKKSISQQKIQQKGVKFQEFLVMLYNYPKQDLKEILNDKDFFQKQIKNSLVTIGQNRRLQSVYNLGLSLNKKGNSMVFRLQDKSQNQSQSEHESQMQPSMVGKDILKQIKQRETDQTTLKLMDGEKILEVKTNNIHHLVKKFAVNMFRTLNLHCRTGELNIKQFTEWIKNHKTLYNNYYNGFHNDIWEFDPLAKKPNYLLNSCQKQALSKYQIDDKLPPIKSYVMLMHSVLIICEQRLNDHPIDIICLQGLEINKIFEQKNGYGFCITHREGYYPPKKIFLKNQAIRDDWNESLKYFKGGAIENVYKMGKKIGTGKFSVVYEGINKQTQNQVAIKVIEYKQLDMDARKLIAHESSIMQIFCHPLLVQFKDCIQTKTHMYIVTELCPGKDLFQFVRQNKHLTQNQSAFIIQQIIVGIRYMHSLGIIHRDLKPQNIMVYYNEKQKKIETVKIIDFGFSNYLSTFMEMSPDQVLAGTPNYIAPELLRGEPINYKTDNFAIGSILYFMLSGMLPFNSNNLTDIFAKTLDGNYSFKGKIWEKVSPKAKDLIDKFLQRQPQERISLDEALKHPWFKQIKQKMTKKILQNIPASQNAIQSTVQASN